VLQPDPMPVRNTYPLAQALTPSPFPPSEGERAPPGGASPGAYAREGGRGRAGMALRRPVLCTAVALPSQELAFDSKMSYTSRARASAHFSSMVLRWGIDRGHRLMAVS